MGESRANHPLPLALLAATATACAAADETDEPAVATTSTATCSVTGPEWGLGGGEMLPGTACLRCHRPGGHARTVLTVAGTVFETASCPVGRPGVTVHVRDAFGQELALQSNAAGNVYSDAELRLPLRVSLSVGDRQADMTSPVPSGDCGACHAPGSPIGLLALGPVETDQAP